MNNLQPVLEVKSLSKDYKKDGRAVEAVHDVSFSLLPGEILGIVGESGSGKSTLLRQIACLERPSAGEIELCGEKSAGRKPADVCRNLQMVFQDACASFDPRMKISSSIDETLRKLAGLNGMRLNKRRAELAVLVGLAPELADRYPTHLSGGQCQRFAVARALAANPTVLLCDEVTSALDVSAQAQIVRLLAKLRDSLGLSIVFVSHDLALVGALCDRILVMRGGKIVEEGVAKAVLQFPREEYTKHLLSSILDVKDNKNA